MRFAFGKKRQPLLSHIYIIIILFAPLRLGQYVRYIDNVGFKSFVLVEIELLVFEFTFRCTVYDHTTFLWEKVSFVAEGYSVLAYVTTSAQVSNDAWIQRALRSRKHA